MLRCLLFVLLLHGFSAFAQKTEEPYQLRSSGIPKNASVKYQTSFPDSLAAIAEVDKIISQLHFSGYFYADIQQANWEGKVLNVDFYAGQGFSSAFLKNGNIQPYILSDIRFREKFFQNQQFDIRSVNQLKEQLLIWYENNGYPFAQVWLDSITFKNNYISSFIYSNPGKQITIDTIRLVGSGKISESFMKAYLGIKNEDNYNEYRISLIDKRLSELSFLKQVKKPEIVFSGYKAKINLFMDKQNANQFDGLIGFLPNTTTGKLQLTGDFKLKLQNALKQAETIDFNYRGLPEQSQELNLRFDYPYIFKTQIGIETDFSFFKRDTTFLNVNARLAFVYNYSTDKSLGFFVERFEGNLISNKSNVLQDHNAGNVSTQFYGLQGNLQRLDNNIMPLSGFKINASFGVGSRKLRDTLAQNNESKSTRFKVFADLGYYWKISSKSVIYLHNVSSILTGLGLYENEVFRIGGLKTFRGFDEQSILAKSFSIQTFEYRYFVEERSYLNLFYDQGIVDQLLGNSSFLSYPFGFGAGFTFQTKAGLLSLSYAMGKQKNIPLDLQKGKIHFGITSYF